MGRRVIIIVAILLSAIGQAQNVNQTDSLGQKHGPWQKKFKNGDIRYEGAFWHGVEIDTFKFYYKGGDLQAKNIFRGKTGNAYSYQYGAGEKLAAEGLYKDTAKDSTWTYYNKQGKVVSKVNYKMGEQHGKTVYYFASGQKAEVLHFKNGKKTGIWKRFYANGELKSKGKYKNGSLDGEAMYYYESGNPRLKAHYNEGKHVGTWIFFTRDGEVDRKKKWGMYMPARKDYNEEQPEREKGKNVGKKTKPGWTPR